MRPNARRFVLVAALGLSLVPFASDAKPGRTPSRPTRTVERNAPPPAPKPLPPAKRLARLNTLLPKLGHEKQDTPPSVVTGLTPVTPLLDTGARITLGQNMGMWGPKETRPNGAYHFDTGTYPSLEMLWPTEVGKTYLMDCAVLLEHGTVDSFSQAHVGLDASGVPESTLAGVDGHVLFAFVAKNNPSYSSLRFVPLEGAAFQRLYWYGCSLAEVDTSDP